jgi:glycogen debranching enzyme
MAARTIAAAALVLLASGAWAEDKPKPRPADVPLFPLRSSGLELSRPVTAGAFYDVAGRRAAAFGYETRGMEAWVYPLKLIDDFRLSFRLEGYPLDIDGAGILSYVTVRPEATIFTYSHAAFTVRQILFAPLREPGLVMLLDVDSTLPLVVSGSFRPALALMWPAGLQTGDLGWDEDEALYTITEETKRFAAIIGAPGAQDLSVMPYQEEPRDVPARFVVNVPLERMRTHYLPIVVAAGISGGLKVDAADVTSEKEDEARNQAKATYYRLLASARELYEANVAHYEALQKRTAWIRSPDPRLDSAFSWAKVGIDKGVVENPLLGTGLVAGFRTSGQSERPGFAWLFGRDALWTVPAVNAYGDFALTRDALEFLRTHQRADGKVTHEVSQSATLIPWFTAFEYPWKSADATPLYVSAQADYWRSSGDLPFLRAAWDSVVRAWRFTAGTDADGNGLVDNTKIGHGWVEGGALYPPHEEIYLQGVWIAACRDMGETAEAMGDATLAGEARAWAERTRAATEKTFWLADRGFYGFATKKPPEKLPVKAQPGPQRARRQQRLEELVSKSFMDEDTVFPAVPLWWGVLDPARAQSQIDHLASAALATDWGHRSLSSRSRLYDPISYHNGSVWPLFTGWASLAAYRHGRPAPGYQALMANALLTFPGALGYVTELLSGDYNTAFSRSSHHQVWSEAMVVTPLLRGLLGMDVGQGGRLLTLAPRLPATWDRFDAGQLPAGEGRYDLTLRRSPGRLVVRLARIGTPGALERLVLAPAFPLDARVQDVTVNGRSARMQARRTGDVQQAEVSVASPAAVTEVVFRYAEGTDVHVEAEAPLPGQRSQGLRVLRARAEGGALQLVVEGRGGRTYTLRARSPHALGRAEGVTVRALGGLDHELQVRFDGAAEDYVRRELTIPLR